jgi:hypothetical protein
LTVDLRCRFGDKLPTACLLIRAEASAVSHCRTSISLHIDGCLCPTNCCRCLFHDSAKLLVLAEPSIVAWQTFHVLGPPRWKTNRQLSHACRSHAYAARYVSLVEIRNELLSRRRRNEFQLLANGMSGNGTKARAFNMPQKSLKFSSEFLQSQFNNVIGPMDVRPPFANHRYATGFIPFEI